MATSSLSYNSDPNFETCFFPFLLPPSIFFLLGVSFFESPSPKRNHDSCFSQIFNFDVRVFSFGLSRYQTQFERCVDVQFLSMSFLNIVVSIFGSFHISKTPKISDMAPFEKTQNINTYNVLKTIQMLMAIKSR
jgi:hypothetical protein